MLNVAFGWVSFGIVILVSLFIYLLSFLFVCLCVYLFSLCMYPPLLSFSIPLCVYLSLYINIYPLSLCHFIISYISQQTGNNPPLLRNS